MSTTEAPTKAQCTALKADGNRCKAYAVKEQTKCAGHLGLGIAADPKTYGSMGAAASLDTRQEQAAARKRSAKDWISHELEHRGREIVAAAADAAIDGDWRAGAWLFDREYGKPAERIDHTVGLDLALLSRTERDDLVRKGLGEGDVIELLPAQYRERLALEP